MQNLDRPYPQVLDHARSADPTFRTLRSIIHIGGRTFFRDSLDLPQRNPGQAGHLVFGGPAFTKISILGRFSILNILH